MKMLSIKKDTAEAQLAEYSKYIDSLSVSELVREFISYLDYTEESDSGRVFHPICISSCRVMVSQPLDLVLSKLRSV